MPRMVEGHTPPALIWLVALVSGVGEVDHAEARRRGDWCGGWHPVLGGGSEWIEYTVPRDPRT